MWAARHRYPYIALNTSLEVTPRMWKLYADTAAEEGYQATPENYGYAIRICVADSDAEAYELGRHFYWQLGRTFGRVPLHWQRPPGYMSRTAMSSQQTALRDTYGDIGYEQAQEVHQVITGLLTRSSPSCSESSTWSILPGWCCGHGRDRCRIRQPCAAWNCWARR